MKGFLIAVILVIGLGVGLFTQVDNIAQSFYEKAQEMEGGQAGKAAFDQLKAESPDQFKQKYQDPFQYRLWICRVTYFIGGDEPFATIAEETRQLYLGSPFDGDEDFCQLMIRNAKYFVDHHKEMDGYTRYNEVLDHFPNTPSKADTENTVKLLRIRLNVRLNRGGPVFAMGRGPLVLAVALLLGSGSPLMAADKKDSADESDVVSLDEGAPSPIPTPTPTFSYSPTAVPTDTAVPEPTASANPAKATDDLSNPGFDQANGAVVASAKGKADDEDNGLVIIAPGAASPEDSLEAFGIDTPFNWREKKRRALSEPETGAAAGDESIELNAPETSDLKDQIAVEEPGKPATEAENYDAVERAGFILAPDDFRFDAYVVRQKDSKHIYGRGDQVFIQMEPGRQVYPGSIYSAFRDDGKVQFGDDGQDLGHLVRAVSVIRVIRVDSESILARVEKQYDAGRVGDGLRLRDPDRARHYASLRPGNTEPPAADLHGAVVALQDGDTTIGAGQHAYLNIGRNQGLLPGMKLVLYRDVPVGKDPLEIMPGPVGKIGELSVVSTQKNTSTVRVKKSTTGVRVGDLVKYR
jgi:hypothetical protein